MPLLLCRALLSIPTSAGFPWFASIRIDSHRFPRIENNFWGSTSHLLSDAASVEQPCFYISICSFHVLLCTVRALKPVWIGHVDKGRVVFHHVFHSSIKQRLCNLQKSRQQFMPLFLYELGSDTSDLSSRRFIKRFPTAMLPCFQMFCMVRCIACHVC